MEFRGHVCAHHADLSPRTKTSQPSDSAAGLDGGAKLLSTAV